MIFMDKWGPAQVSQDVSGQIFLAKNLKMMYLKTTGPIKNVIVLNCSKKVIFSENRQNRRFWGSGPPSLDTPQNRKIDKTGQNNRNFMSNHKNGQNSRKYGISSRFADFRVKNALIRPISLFVYYNSSDHWAKIFLYFSFLWSTSEKFVIWVFFKRKIVPSWCALFLEKTTRSDICWPRAAGVAQRPKKFLWKT